MGNAYCQSADYGLTETNKETMELLGIGYDGQNHAHALVNCYTFFEEPEKDWLAILKSNELPPAEPMLFD